MMSITVLRREVSEARLRPEQVEQFRGSAGAQGPVVVLQGESLGESKQWVSQLPAAADRIVIEYGAGRSRFDRAWVLAKETPKVRYYTLEQDASSTGYVSH
jgi:hypothetical protein